MPPDHLNEVGSTDASLHRYEVYHPRARHNGGGRSRGRGRGNGRGGHSRNDGRGPREDLRGGWREPDLPPAGDPAGEPLPHAQCRWTLALDQRWKVLMSKLSLVWGHERVFFVCVPGLAARAPT